jgi:hypothetical protein
MGSLMRLLLLAALLGVSYHYWRAAHSPMAEGPISYAQGDFVAVAMPDGLQHNTVLILAPLNCPSQAARRANSLASELSRMGIPNRRDNHYGLHLTAPPNAELQASIERTNKILAGEIPAVFVNGMAKANPSPQEVAAVYERTR